MATAKTSGVLIVIALVALYFLLKPASSSSSSTSSSSSAPSYNRQDVPYTQPYQGIFGLDWF